MTVEIECPVEFQGPVQGDLSSKRGRLKAMDMRDNSTVIVAEVPLAELFGYVTRLRSLTQGKATFCMRYLGHRPVSPEIQEEVIKKSQKDEK